MPMKGEIYIHRDTHAHNMYRYVDIGVGINRDLLYA